MALFFLIGMPLAHTVLCIKFLPQKLGRTTGAGICGLLPVCFAGLFGVQDIALLYWSYFVAAYFFGVEILGEILVLGLARGFAEAWEIMKGT